MKGRIHMELLLVFVLFSVSAVFAAEEAFIGVNIGTSLSDMPHPTQVVTLLKAQKIRHVRLYDADRGMLLALANTGIKVVIAVPNEQILGIGQSNSNAAKWVSQNVVAHYPATNITTICVGSEVLNNLPNAASILVNALKFIQSALVASNLDRQIKVSTPFPSSIILDICSGKNLTLLNGTAPAIDSKSSGSHARYKANSFMHTCILIALVFFFTSLFLGDR